MNIPSVNTSLPAQARPEVRVMANEAGWQNRPKPACHPLKRSRKRKNPLPRNN